MTAEESNAIDEVAWIVEAARETVGQFTEYAHDREFPMSCAPLYLVDAVLDNAVKTLRATSDAASALRRAA